MENATDKTSKLTELITRFANKVYKFKSTGVFPDQNSSNPNNPLVTEVVILEERKDTFTEAKPTRKILTFRWDELFDVVSSLKLAYLKFQKAHLPYDPDKIIEADNLVVSQLEALRRIKRLYLKTKQLNAKIEVNEKRLVMLEAQVRAKESEIQSLKESIVSVSSFEFAFRAASKSVHDFAKPLITLMKATDWNLDKAVESIVGNVRYAKNSDKKYAFESYIVRRMFHGLKLNPCDVTELMRFDDPLEALTAYPDSGFAKFCGQKYLLVVHPSMEASFFGNLDMRALVLLGKHPRTMFYRIFAKMAKWVWILGSFAGSLDLKANIFTVRRGTRFSSDYMESIVGDENDDLSVEFITMPGFKIGDSVIKSQVYLSKTKG